ncbi:hypothetical protein B0H14DRAFT_2573877 [Mycena olivaceomarginata]|nr:hypothetical protein B0H14DRAFT_2573877 [Mycena olivaceomarginata]
MSGRRVAGEGGREGEANPVHFRALSATTNYATYQKIQKCTAGYSPISARAGPSNENTHATSVEPCLKRRRINLEASLYGKSDEEVWDEMDAAIISWQKANAVLDLAREGYLSETVGVVLYEKAGVDQRGLTLFNCTRGPNKLQVARTVIFIANLVHFITQIFYFWNAIPPSTSPVASHASNLANGPALRTTGLSGVDKREGATAIGGAVFHLLPLRPPLSLSVNILIRVRTHVGVPGSVGVCVSITPRLALRLEVFRTQAPNLTGTCKSVISDHLAASRQPSPISGPLSIYAYLRGFWTHEPVPSSSGSGKTSSLSKSCHAACLRDLAFPLSAASGMLIRHLIDIIRFDETHAPPLQSFLSRRNGRGPNVYSMTSNAPGNYDVLKVLCRVNWVLYHQITPGHICGQTIENLMKFMKTSLQNSNLPILQSGLIIGIGAGLALEESLMLITPGKAEFGIVYIL